MRLFDKIKNQPPLWWFYQQFVVFVLVVMFTTSKQCNAGWVSFSLVWLYNSVVITLVRFCGIHVSQKITVMFNMLISMLMGVSYYETSNPVYIAGIVITTLPIFPILYDILAVIMRWPTTRRLLRCKPRQSMTVMQIPSAPKLSYDPQPSAPKLSEFATLPNSNTNTSLNLDNVNIKTIAMPDDCSICLESMDDAKKCGVLSCAHVFHTWCIEEWLAIGHSCPLCRNSTI